MNGLGVRRIDPRKLKAKYSEERSKRMHPDSGRQYSLAKDSSNRLTEDLWRKSDAKRPLLQEDMDVLVVGGGMSGIMTATRLMQNGITDIRLIERGADFGGTWYWNQYPGAACDSESYIYMPFLDDTGYVPTEKYAGQLELQTYLKQLAHKFEITPRTLFSTKVDSLRWDEDTRRWIVRTDLGDVLRPRFVALCAGSFLQPKMPSIPGIDQFKGHMFLNSRWDYDYTGGSPGFPQLTGLRDKRVAIIGTGCSSVQSVPHLAKWAQELSVIQRTPSMVNYRANRPTDPEWAKSLEPGWQEKRMANFEACLLTPNEVTEDLVADGWTDLARSMADLDGAKAAIGDGDDGSANLAEIADYLTMAGNWERIDEIVSDEATAEALKAFYYVNCKRPTFHDDYLEAFNRPNVRLVNTDGKGVESILPDGVVVDGQLIEVDCIIFATGFEVFTPTYLTGQYSVQGIGGQSLEQKWEQNFRTLHGVMTAGFPNMVLVGHMRDGGGTTNSNFPFHHQATHVASIIKKTMEAGAASFEVTEQAEDAWRQTMRDKAPPIHQFLIDCTPGYLNNDGKVGDSAVRLSIYGGGSLEYASILQDWRNGSGFRNDLKFVDG